jgi:hypothetical protein
MPNSHIFPVLLPDKNPFAFPYRRASVTATNGAGDGGQKARPFDFVRTRRVFRDASHAFAMAMHCWRRDTVPRPVQQGWSGSHPHSWSVNSGG